MLRLLVIPHLAVLDAIVGVNQSFVKEERKVTGSPSGRASEARGVCNREVGGLSTKLFGIILTISQYLQQQTVCQLSYLELW